MSDKFIQYPCGTDRRKNAAKIKSNGIDFLEVTVPEKSGSPITDIRVHFLTGLPVTALKKENFGIVGRPDALPVRVKSLEPSPSTDESQIVTISVEAPGDSSIYTLRISNLPTSFDPQLAQADFTFRRERPASMGPAAPATPTPVEPLINYLAKDYASFRRLMLDRTTLFLPGGVEDQPADLQVGLIELLAYTADRLSYYQDAVATEAYLGTARSRISLRRHVRLLDYRIGEGCNARVWVCCQVTSECPVKENWRFLSEEPDPVVFEPCHCPKLYPQNNDARGIDVYAWGELDYELPAGTTKATLTQKDPKLELHRGDLLLFEAVEGGNGSTLPHVVRLTDVQDGNDPVEERAVVEVTWGAEDAFPFALPLLQQSRRLAVARGNVVLADHGKSTWKSLSLSPPVSGVPYRLLLPDGPLAWAEPLPDDLTNPKKGDALTSAAGLQRRDARAALPLIKLGSNGNGWVSRYDLLGSDDTDAAFVVETENDGSAQLRFGDNVYGRCPNPTDRFDASYRIGNGRAGNVGAEAICRVVVEEDKGKVTEMTGVTVRNPLPAQGGTDPEPAEAVRLFAPQALRTQQQRAINASDYAARAQGFPGVQQAAAAFRWTGSWYTVYLFVDRMNGRAIDEDFKGRLLRHLEGYRLAGYDIEIRGPTYVPLEITLSIEVKPDFAFNAVAVRGALEEALSNRELPGGKRGYFHPNNWTFGQPVYLSRLYGAALEVPGVASVNATAFGRSGRADEPTSREQGVLPIGPHEIARLDNLTIE
jgi:hypothetical protein